MWLMHRHSQSVCGHCKEIFYIFWAAGSLCSHLTATHWHRDGCQVIAWKRWLNRCVWDRQHNYALCNTWCIVRSLQLCPSMPLHPSDLRPLPCIPVNCMVGHFLNV